jgi:hypothetical protein
MSQKVVRTLNVFEVGKANLGNDGAELADGSRNTVGSRTVTRREGLSGYHERRYVWAKVLEKVGETVQEHKYFPTGVGGR